MSGESRVTFHASRFTFHASRLADGALLLVALIWGATFVMVKNAVTTYPVLSFLALRFAFAALVLLPVILLRRSGKPTEGFSAGSGEPPHVILPDPGQVRDGVSGSVPSVPRRRQDSEESHRVKCRDSSLEALRSGSSLTNPLRVTGVLAAPLLMGLALFAGYALQTFGLRLTTPAKAGFITGLSVVIVPVLSTLVLRQRLGRGAWLGVGLATAGMALLSLQVADPVGADLSMSPGDLLVLGCAVAFACQILLTGRFASHYDPLWLTFGQILVVALLAGIAGWILESPPAPSGPVVLAAAFTGVLATSLAFGIQTVAQRFTSPTRTALIYSTEPVFAALFSYLLIGEVLGLRQLVGCALILAGMVTVEGMRNGRTGGETSGG